MGIKFWWPLLFVVMIITACILIFPSDLRLADLLGRAGKLDEAIQNYQQILEKFPNRNDIRIELGNLYLKKNDLKNALTQFEFASTDIIRDTRLLHKLYQIYSSLNIKDKTIATLEKIVNFEPENVEYKDILAEAYEWNNDTDQAIILYKNLHAENPEEPKYLNKLIYLNFNKKNFSEVIYYLKKQQALQPHNIESRILSGNVYLETDQKLLAALEFEKALKMEPDSESLRLRLADLYIWMQDYEKGILHYEYLLMSHVLNDRYFNTLVDLTKDTDPAKAIKYYNFRLNYLSRNDALRESFVDLYLYLGQTDEAVEQLRVLLERQPENLTYLLKLGEIYQNIREPDLASQVYENIILKGYQEQDVIDALVDYYTFEQKYDRLLKLYSTLLSTNKASPQILEAYSDLSLRTRNYEQARKLFAILMEEYPRNLQYRLQLAKLFENRNNSEQAIKLINQGLEKYDPLDEPFLLYAAQLFARHKYNQKSIYCYEKLTSVDKNNTQYKKLLIEQYTQAGEFEKAENVFYDLLALEPNNLDNKLQLASLYWLQNDDETMHKINRGIIASTKDTSHLHKKIGQFYFDRAYLNEAITHFKIELSHSPTDSATLRMLGLAYAWNNQPNVSKIVLRKYHELYKHDYYTHFQLGALQYTDGDRGNAAHEFQTALQLIEQMPESIESTTVKAQVYAYQNDREKATAEFEKLISKYPDNLSIKIDYAETLLNLKDYQQAKYWTVHVLQKDPANYRAWRLQSRNYFEQGKYVESAHILQELRVLHAHDLGLQIDLADAELASGDWYESTKTLERALNKYPKTIPAQERLNLLRRQQNESFASEYKVEKQSNNIFKQVFNFVYSKAASSLLHFKFLFEEEKYSARALQFDDEKYLNLGIQISSRYNSKHETSFAVKAQQHQGDWNISGAAKYRRYFSPANSVTLSSTLNELWNDPFISAFYQGRKYGLNSDLNLYLLNRIFLWHQLSFERYTVYKTSLFGEAFRAYVQLGYEWHKRPQFLTYYQFSNLNFQYKNQAQRDLIPIRTKESIHYLGAALNNQLSSKFYYQLGGSLGYNTSQNNMLFYATLDLEYMLMRQIRLRTHFVYGNQNRLAGNEENKSVSLDLNYFY